MDPRLNHPPQPLNDIRPTASAAQPPAQVPAQPTAQQIPAASEHSSVKTEIVGEIPVKQQGQAAVVATQAANPIIQMPSSPIAQAEPEDDLEKILQAVNNRVAQPTSDKNSKKAEAAKKVAKKAASLPHLLKGGPIVIAVVAVAIAFSLSVLAFYSFKHAPAKLSGKSGVVGTTYAASDAIQQAGGTLVRPADLDDYSSQLQTKLNALNDSGDFDSTPINDKVLGL